MEQKFREKELHVMPQFQTSELNPNWDNNNRLAEEKNNSKRKQHEYTQAIPCITYI